MIRDVLAWALATELVGLAILPLLRCFFDNRRDAALLSRPIGLAVVAYAGWLLSLTTPLGFRRVTLLIALVAVAAVSHFVRRRAASDSAAGAPWWWWQWGDEEKLGAILFWGSTGVFILIRAAGPAILGAEKFMDLAFLNSLARFPAMPPGDPWMAGKTVNYYYWGYLLAAAQAQLSGVAPMTAYNLSVASFAGFSFAAAACLGLRLSGGRLGVGPHEIAESLLGHAAPAQRNERLQELERLLLRLALDGERLGAMMHGEAAQRMDVHRPRPRFRCLRNRCDTSHLDIPAHELCLDLMLERERAQSRAESRITLECVVELALAHLAPSRGEQRVPFEPAGGHGLERLGERDHVAHFVHVLRGHHAGRLPHQRARGREVVDHQPRLCFVDDIDGLDYFGSPQLARIG